MGSSGTIGTDSTGSDAGEGSPPAPLRHDRSLVQPDRPVEAVRRKQSLRAEAAMLAQADSDGSSLTPDAGGGSLLLGEAGSIDATPLVPE